MPDCYFEKFSNITPEFLLSRGIRCLLIDIDNTLAPYEQATPTEVTVKWFEELHKSGISAVLISNNHRQRVDTFNASLGLDAYPDANKPSIKYYLQALKKLGCKVEESAVLGDQLLTDALAGRRLGAQVIIVPPIKDKTSLFFRVKRAIEKPYIKKFRKSQPK